MITQTAKYAIRALIHLSERHESGFCQTREIAQTTRVPSNYLGKTLQKLAHARVLDSQKGLHGGFRIARTANNISLYEILVAIEAIPRDFSPDPDDDLDDLPSGIYARFAQMSQMYVDFLKRTTLADLVASTRPEKPAVSRQPAQAQPA